MDAFRAGLIRIADDISLAFQHAGQMFAFLEDGRDLVAISDGEGGRVATFRDHSDEGWPEVRVGLPVDATFVYAASGMLTREAAWQVRRAESEVVQELSSHPGVPVFESRSGRGVVAKLGFNATLTVKGFPDEMKGVTGELTGLKFKQVRKPEAIRTVRQKQATR